uniref:Pectate lyase superfamily protein domain-containing protein n=1 Tax=Fagus sylvatica TaxID=28930 RepID=A0A2N9IPX9_FAGSY
MGKNLSIVTLSLLLLLASTGNALNVFDVRTYGAHPNADITQALLNAWKDACAAAGSSRVVVPAGIYKLGVVSFKGPCKGPIELQVQGTIQAPGDPGYFKGSDGWIRFQYIDQFTLSDSAEHWMESTSDVHPVSTLPTQTLQPVMIVSPLGDGSKDVTITKVTCGPGHGISIGSLGKYPNEEPVSGIKSYWLHPYRYIKWCKNQNMAF